jgi:DNA repair protein RecO (recombination protein O)
MRGQVHEPFTIEAFCLRTWNYGEADRIVAFHAAEQGNIRAIAKGAKKPKSKLAAACQPLTRARVSLIPGQNLAVVRQVEPLEAYPALREHLLAMALALLTLDLVLEATQREHHSPDSETIDTLLRDYLDTMEREAKSPVRPREALMLAWTVAFQQALLATLGYAPQWSHCAQCQRAVQAPAGMHPQGGPFYHVSLAAGGVLCAPCQAQQTAPSLRVSDETRQLLRQPLGAATCPPAPVRWLGAFRLLQRYAQEKLETHLPAYEFLYQAIQLQNA